MYHCMCQSVNFSGFVVVLVKNEKKQEQNLHVQTLYIAEMDFVSPSPSFLPSFLLLYLPLSPSFDYPSFWVVMYFICLLDLMKSF